MDRAIVIVDDIPALQQVLANELLSRSADAITRRGRFVLALPGGSVASTFFPGLGRLAIDWSHVDLFWIDERAVPPDHPDSNYGLASRLLLHSPGVTTSRVHRMRGELADLEEAAQGASDELTMLAGNPPQLDLALVGVGEDGHVASIFAGVTGLPPSRKATADHRSLGEGGQSSPRPVMAIYDAPKPPTRRLTMTLDVIASAGRVIVAGFGPTKAHVIRNALHAEGAPMPVATLLRRASSSIVLLDHPYSH